MDCGAKFPKIPDPLLVIIPRYDILVGLCSFKIAFGSRTYIFTKPIFSSLNLSLIFPYLESIQHPLYIIGACPPTHKIGPGDPRFDASNLCNDVIGQFRQ